MDGLDFCWSSGEQVDEWCVCLCVSVCVCVCVCVCMCVCVCGLYSTVVLVEDLLCLYTFILASYVLCMVHVIRLTPHDFSDIIFQQFLFPFAPLLLVHCYTCLVL